MKKIAYLIATFAVLLFTSSGFNEDIFNPVTGNPAAPLNLENSTGTLSLDDYKGEYVLLSFWRSDDGASRAECNRAKAIANAAAGTEVPVKHIGINMDEDADLFEALAQSDGLDAASQYNVSGDAARRVASAYGLHGNLGTLLLDKDGRILAVNADQDTFDRLTR